jgi:hypothetical protein
VISVKLTSDALGLGSADVNDGGTVDADVAGKLVTSPTLGQGSILTIQKSGVAGPGTGLDPLLVTVTSVTHQDNVAGTGTDFKAGVIYLTKENANTPDGKDEGLGVRAFTVDTNGARTFSGGLAKIEGSKEVSGGTDLSTTLQNGPPHVDECATFVIDPGTSLKADSFVVRMSKMEATDLIDLHLTLLDNSVLDYSFIGPGDAGWTEVGSGNKLYDLAFSGLAGIDSLDFIKNFTICAVDPADAPGATVNAKSTAEHFLITGFIAETGIPNTGETPEPASLGLLGLGAVGLLMRRRK